MTHSPAPTTVSPLPVSQQLEDLVLAGGRRRWRAQTTALTHDPSLTPTQQQLASTALQLQSANYTAVLSSADTTALFAFLSSADLTPSTVTVEWLTSQLSASIAAFVQPISSSSDDDSAAVQTRLLFVAIALLQSFVSVNWTGLPLPAALLLPASADTALVTAVHTACHSILSLDGEDIFDQSTQPLLLTLARLLLTTHGRHVTRTRSAGWWTVRLLAVHHAMMETNTATIKQHMDTTLPALLTTYDIPTHPTLLTAQLAASLRIELSTLQLEYWQYDAAHTCLETAQSVCGVNVAVTGVMGKRTRWQQDKKSQLVVTAERRPSSEQSGGGGGEQEKETKESEEEGKWDEEKEDEQYMPSVQQLDSDVLLPSLALDQHIHSIALSAVQRALLLALSNFLTTAASTHITLREQQLAYLQTILASHSQRSWAVEQCALYHRSILELDDKHKQDRALQQLEDMCQLTPSTSSTSLLDTDTDTDSERRVRMEDVYVSGWPAVWRVKLVVGGWFERLGLLRSALELYDGMQWMDGIIEMNVALQRRSIADQLIRSRLATSPTPKLHCLLADLTGDISHYEAAWQLSGQSYPRAQRSLARYYRDRQQWSESIDHSQLALQLNPVFPMEWFSVGHCHLQLNQYTQAATAFAKVVSYDPDYADGWNNLAACHLHSGADASAVLALAEAVRLNWDSWKVWDNMLLAAVRVQDWSRAMQAVERVMALKEKGRGVDASVQQEAVDVAIVDVINTAMIDEVAVNKATQPAEQYAAEEWRRDRWDKVLQSLLSRTTTDPRLWQCEAQWRRVLGEVDKEVEARERAYRTALLPIPASHPSVRTRFSAYQLADGGAAVDSTTGAVLVWSSHVGMFDTAVDMLLQLLHCYEWQGGEQRLYAGKLAVEGFVDSVAKKADGVVRARWEERRAEVESEQKRIAEKRQQHISEAAEAVQSTAAAAAVGSGSGAVAGIYSSYASMWR